MLQAPTMTFFFRLHLLIQGTSSCQSVVFCHRRSPHMLTQMYNFLRREKPRFIFSIEPDIGPPTVYKHKPSLESQETSGHFVSAGLLSLHVDVKIPGTT